MDGVTREQDAALLDCILLQNDMYVIVGKIKTRKDKYPYIYTK